MNIFEIVVYGVCRTIIGHYKVTNSSKEEAMFVATKMLLSDGVDMKDVVSLEADGQVYNKFIYCIQVYSGKLDKEYFVDGYLLADNAQRARNFAQLQANAIVDETANRGHKLKVMGIGVQPIFEVVI
jgi:hypothetical protein